MFMVPMKLVLMVLMGLYLHVSILSMFTVPLKLVLVVLMSIWGCSKGVLHLAGAAEQEARLGALSQAQHVHGANEAGLDGLDGVVPAHEHYQPALCT